MSLFMECSFDGNIRVVIVKPWYYLDLIRALMKKLTSFAVICVNNRHESFSRPIMKVRDHPPCATRILLPDGRHMAYDVLGVSADRARFSIIAPHSFLSSRFAGKNYKVEYHETLEFFEMQFSNNKSWIFLNIGKIVAELTFLWQVYRESKHLCLKNLVFAWLHMIFLVLGRVILIRTGI